MSQAKFRTKNQNERMSTSLRLVLFNANNVTLNYFRNTVTLFYSIFKYMLAALFRYMNDVSIKILSKHLNKALEKYASIKKFCHNLRVKISCSHTDITFWYILILYVLQYSIVTFKYFRLE